MFAALSDLLPPPGFSQSAVEVKVPPQLSCPLNSRSSAGLGIASLYQLSNSVVCFYRIRRRPSGEDVCGAKWQECLSAVACLYGAKYLWGRDEGGGWGGGWWPGERGRWQVTLQLNRKSNCWGSS